jgi:uncharacterized repeat protein (TIGR03943 family)
VTLIDRSRAALATGLLALWIGGTNAMLKYLRPSMRPWLLTAAVALIAIGVYGLARERRLARTHHDDDHHGVGRGRIGWLLVVPVVVMILFGPQPMGDFAIGRTPNLPPYAFDIAAYASQTGQHVPDLRFVDVLQGSEQAGNRDYLTSHDVTLEGFVSRPEISGAGTFLFTRYLISCCAADAQPLSVVINGAPSIPPKGRWAHVTARLESGARGEGKLGPVLTLSRIELIKAPANTYETLRR